MDEETEAFERVHEDGTTVHITLRGNDVVAVTAYAPEGGKLKLDELGDYAAWMQKAAKAHIKSREAKPPARKGRGR